MAQAPQAQERDIAEVLAELDNPAERQAPQAGNQPVLAAAGNNMAQAPCPIDQPQPVSYL